MKKKQFRKSPSRCAFCPYTGKLTDEHMFPKWLIDYLPLDLASANHQHSTSLHVVEPYNGMEAGESSKVVKISGDPGSRTLKVVCGPCNSGWMSTLQTKVIPLISEAVKGGWAPFGDYAELIARWCLMTTMVSEFDQPTTIAFTQQDRENLRLGLTFPPNVVIWIGRMPRENPSRQKKHRGYKTRTSMDLQASSFHIGDFFFQIANFHQLDLMSMQAYAYLSGLKLLWPSPNRSLLNSPPGMTSDILIKSAQIRLTNFFEDYVFRDIRTHLILPTATTTEPWTFSPMKSNFYTRH